MLIHAHSFYIYDQENCIDVHICNMKINTYLKLFTRVICSSQYKLYLLFSNNLIEIQFLTIFANIMISASYLSSVNRMVASNLPKHTYFLCALLVFELNIVAVHRILCTYNIVDISNQFVSSFSFNFMTH